MERRNGPLRGPGDGQAGGDPKAGTDLHATGAQLATERLDALPHARQSATRALVPRWAAEAVVGDLDPQGRGRPLQPDGHAGGSGVLDGVGQRLLHQPVDRSAEVGRDSMGRAVFVEDRVQPGHARLFDESRQVHQPRLRVPARTVAAQHPQGSVELAHRLAPCLGDGVERGRRLVRFPGHDRAGFGLNDHEADRVGHDVMDFAGDAFPFPHLRHLPLLGQPVGAFLQHGDTVAAGPYPGAQGVGGHEQQPDGTYRRRPLIEDPEDGHDQTGAGDCRSDQPPDRRCHGGDRVRRHQLSVRQGDVVLGAGQGQPDRANADQTRDGDRMPAPPHQRQ
jgi:hypothetical protein